MLHLKRLIIELKRRRVHRVIVVYAAAAWVIVEVADTTLPALHLPDWTVTFVVVLAILGFPVAVILAWAFDITPAGLRRTAPAAPELELAGPLGARVSVGLAAVVLVSAALAVAAFITWRIIVAPSEALDRARVVVYPLAVAEEADEGLGEDLATWIGYTLESSGRLRWVDGWYLLDQVQRAGLQPVPNQSASSRAQGLGAALYVRGRVSLARDSVRIVLELHDVAGDSILGRGMASGPLDADWKHRESERAAHQLLSALLPTDQTIELAVPSDSPSASAQFLAGERAYRRARFVEALGHFESAVEADSFFALAALRGSLAACWLPEGRERYGKAQTLLDVALRRTQFLSPHHAHFGYGIREYLAGRADSAVSQLIQALAIAPDWWDAWARLGEVYYHLLPRSSPLDSLAEAAFLEVRRNDPEFYPVLFHLIEHALRKGEIDLAEGLVQELRVVGPDSARLYLAELMLECVKNTPEMVDWRVHVMRQPNLVFEAAGALATGGYQTECARAGWTAILVHDTADMVEWGAGFNRRFATLLALQSLLAAEGRYEDLTRLLESDTRYAAWLGDIYLLDALAGAGTEAQAHRHAESLREQYRSEPQPVYVLWLLGAWDAHSGRVDEAREVADLLGARADSSDARLDGLLAVSLVARVALASGDSAEALRLLSALVPTKPPGESWYPWETLAYEQLALAELLQARGEHAKALRVAANLDAPARPPEDLIYLPASLSLRLRAALALGNDELVEHYRARLTALGRVDLLR